MPTGNNQEPDIKQTSDIFHVEIDQLRYALGGDGNHQNKSTQYHTQQRLPDFRSKSNIEFSKPPRLHTRQCLHQPNVRFKQ